MRRPCSAVGLASPRQEREDKRKDASSRTRVRVRVSLEETRRGRRLTDWEELEAVRRHATPGYLRTMCGAGR